MAVPAEKELSGDHRWALVTRVVESCHFEKAVQLRDLLVYLAKIAITTPSAGITEQEIGVHVLGRRPDYDPQADNIVRVQIRHLRQKLDKYFLTDGAQEPVVICVPKGSHLLRFEPRPAASPVETPARARITAGRNAWVVLAIAGALFGFFAGRLSLGRTPALAAGRSAFSTNPLWSRLFVKDQPTSIVIADSSAVIVQNILRKDLTLSEYIDHSYRELIEAVPDPGLREALRIVSNRQYTSLADATLSGELRLLGAGLGAKVAVRYARHMQIRDFHSGNFILIGSSHSVPWVELFEPSLTFHFERVGKEQRFGFRNNQPGTGESPIYVSSNYLNGRQESFATISMLPNPARNGIVLMFAGVTMEATEAAGQYAMTEDFLHVAARALGTRRGEELPFFEILLKTIAVAGAPHKVDVVAWRKPAS